MRQVRFLGLICPESTKPGEFGSPTSLPSVITIPEWTMSLDGAALLTVQCVVNYGSATQVSLSLKLRTVITGDLIKLADGNHDDSDTTDAYVNIVSPVPTDPAVGSGVEVRSGPLRLTGSHGQNWVRSQNEQLMIAVQQVEGFALKDLLPVRLVVSDDPNFGFVSPNLALGQLEVLAEGVVLETSTPAVRTGGRPWRGQVLRHANEAISVDLSNPAHAATLFFTGNTAPLPLHVEQNQRGQPVSTMNHLTVPLKSRHHRLRLLLARPPDVDEATLLEMALHPAADGALVLTTAALAGTDNVAKDWTIAGLAESGLKLRVRIADTTRCGTLLLDQSLAADGSPKALALAMPTVPGSLHAELADALVHGTTSGAALHCQLLTRHRAQDSNGMPYPGRASLAEAMLAEGTAPHLLWQTSAADKPSFNHARTGATYRTTNTPGATVIDTLKFTGPALAMPLLPLAHVDQALGADQTKAFRKALDTVITGHVATPPQVTHETQRKEKATSTVGIASAFLPSAAVQPIQADAQGNAFTLAAFDVNHDYGEQVLNVTLPRAAGIDPDFIVIDTVDAAGNPVSAPSVDLDPAYKGVALSGSFHRGDSTIPMKRGILKFTRRRSLRDIVDHIGDANLQQGFDLVEPKMPEYVKREDWTGVVFFDVGVTLNEDILKGVIPSEVLQDLRFSFVAVSPRLPGQGGGYSVSANVSWTNPAVSWPPVPGTEPGDNPPEAAFLVLSVNGSWDNTTLQSLVIRTMVRFDGCFGLTNPKQAGSPAVELDGTYDRKTHQVWFAARADRPIEILPDDVAGDARLPIQQVTVHGAVISMVRGRARITIDGSIKIRDFDPPGVIRLAADGTEISFRGLGISLPESPTTKSAISLGIDYPSFQLNFDGPKFALGPLRLTLAAIGIDFHNDFSWDGLLQLSEGSIKNKNTLLLGLHIEFMKLPAIADKTLERLTFNLQLGLPVLGGGASWDLGSARAAIGALGFDKLDLDLFRFIEISADHVDFANTLAPPTATLTVNNLKVKVLDYEVIQAADAFFFARGGETGFFMKYMPAHAAIGGFTVNWAVIGHNLSLPPDTVKRLLEIDPPDAIPDPTPPVLPASPIPATPGSGSNWLIGASVSALSDFFQGRFIYDEAGTIGLALKAGFLKEWFGLDLAVAVDYARGRRSEEDTFAVALTIPRLVIGDIDFIGGVVAFDFQVDGGFLLDLGFPWPIGATRQWYRALGAIITPFQGSGGVYIERRNLYEDQETVVHLAGGYAVQVGLGAAFGGGMFTAWVTIGLYASLDGDVYLSGGSVVAMRITGAVGVLFQGHGELNFWIISISVDVMVSAEASATVAWLAAGQAPTLLPDATPGAPARLRIDFTVYASASASACIRLGFVHICRGISVTIPMRAAFSLPL